MGDQVQVIVRMPAELHEAVKAAAEREERSMAQQIRFWCREATREATDG